MGAAATWRDLEHGAAELAALGRARLEAVGVAFLGTVRADGTPRISPVEPHLVTGQLIFGAMAWSEKVRDLGRDPRCVLHSVVTGPETGEGELKLHGRAARADGLRDEAGDAWWSAWPADKAVVFSLLIETAVFVEWDLHHGRMVVHRWSPAAGADRRTRAYP